MASRHRSIAPRSRSSAGSIFFRVVGVLALLIVALVVFVFINGELTLPFGGGTVFAFERNKEEAPRVSLPKGTVAVLACPRALPAFTKLSREHFFNAQGFHTVPAVEQAIEPNGLFRADNEGIKRLLGRVLKRPKRVNFAYTENDLLPKGTRPGPSAGIPPGQRAVWINLADVQGLAGAGTGDHIDLVAARTEEAAPQSNPSFESLSDPLLRARLMRAAKVPKRRKEARSWVIAHDALVVTAARTREIRSGSAQKPGTIVEEAFVAMKPAAVARLSQALAQKVTLVAAPRSGQPGGEDIQIEDVKPPDPTAAIRRILMGDDDSLPLQTVEVISGDTRKTITVRRAKDKKKDEKESGR